MNELHEESKHKYYLPQFLIELNPMAVWLYGCVDINHLVHKCLGVASSKPQEHHLSRPRMTHDGYCHAAHLLGGKLVAWIWKLPTIVIGTKDGIINTSHEIRPTLPSPWPHMTLSIQTCILKPEGWERGQVMELFSIHLSLLIKRIQLGWTQWFHINECNIVSIHIFFPPYMYSEDMARWSCVCTRIWQLVLSWHYLSAA